MSVLDIYNFFFEYKISSYFAAILRVLYCGYFFFSFLYIFKYIIIFSDPKGPYSTNFYLNANIKQTSLFNLKNLRESKLAQIIILFLFIVSGITSIFGFFTNLSILIFLLTYASLQARADMILYSDADVFARVMLFSLLLIDCGSKYSIDYLLGMSSNLEMIDGWSLRIIQLTIIGAYFTSAIQKTKDTYWLQGVALRNAALSVAWGRRIFKKFFLNLFIAKTLNYGTICFQLFSPILFLIKETRPFAILFSIGLHLGMLVFLRIWFFAPTVILALLSFCNQYFTK
jgi:hypothetical protein